MESIFTSHSERFEAAFNRIHKCLLNVVKNAQTNRFTSLVNAGAKRHHMIRHYQDDLFQFAKLRNALVHEKVDIGYYIAEPHEKVVELIEKIGEQLDKPKSVLTIATKPVVCFDNLLPLKEAMIEIKRSNHTQFPIYQDGEYCCLLTSKGIMNWMADHMIYETISNHHTLIKDLEAVEQEHSVEFLSRHKSVFDVEDLFESYHARNEKLEAVLITERGREDEVPLGIITSWDLVEVDMLE